MISQMPGKVILRNFEGVITTYTEPEEYKSECTCEDCKSASFEDGVAGLMHGSQISLEPQKLSRKMRNHKE